MDKIKIDNGKLLKCEGIEFKGEFALENCLFYLQGMLYFLKTHNKNLTKEQYYKINTIANILDCLTVEK